MESIFPKSFDEFQFAYRPNRSTDDAVSLTLQNILQYVDKRTKTHARLLFIDFSSAFYAISPTSHHIVH